MHKKQDTQTPNFQKALFRDSNQRNQQTQNNVFTTPPPKEDQKQSQYPQGGFLPNKLKTPPSTEQHQQQQKLNPSNIYKIQNNIKVEINNTFPATSQLFNPSGKGGSGSFKSNKAKPVLEGTDRLVQLINEAISFSKKDPEPIYWTNLFLDSTQKKYGNQYKCSSKNTLNDIGPIAHIEYKIKDNDIKNKTITPYPGKKIDETKLSSALKKITTHEMKDAIQEFPADFDERIEEISGLFSLSKLDCVRINDINDINNYIESFYLLKKLKLILGNKSHTLTGQSTIDKLIQEKGHFINHLSKSGYYKTKSEYAEENRNNCNKFPICFQPPHLDDEPFEISGEVAHTRFSFSSTSNQKVKFFTKLQKNYIKDIKQQLKNNSSDITVISGPPGSGKTDLIKFLTESNIAAVKRLLGIENGSDIKFSHLNYGSFYTYDNYGKKKEKSEADIKGIIDELIANKSLITNQSENQKLLLFVDEWGVMYPKYAINYLKEKQLQSGNIAIIGVTAHQEPAKALLDHESEKGIKIKYINPQISAGSENNNQNITSSQNDEFIVDFTREINDYNKFQSFLTNSSIPLPATKPYIIINQYKDPADNSDKYMLAKVDENRDTIISKKKNNGTQSNNYHALNKEELLEEVNKIKKENQAIKTIYHYSFSVARGGDMGMFPEGQNKNYKVILNDLSSVIFVDNLEQALTRDRSFNVQDLSTDKKINIKCFKRNEKNGLERYSPQEITKKINDRNNFFNLNNPHNQNSDNGSRNSDLSTDISEEDSKFLMKEIDSQSEEDKNITKIIVSYLDLIKKLPDSIDKKKSIDLLIENNKESTANFMVCYNRAKIIERLIKPSIYKRETIDYHIRSSRTMYGQTIDINKSALSIQIDARGCYTLSQVPMHLTSQNEIKQQITLSPLNQKSSPQNLFIIPEEDLSQKEGDLSTQQQDLQSNSFNSKKFKYLKEIPQQISTQNLSPPEQQNSWSCGKIDGAIIGALGLLVGGIGYGVYYFTSAGNSTGSVSVAPASPVTPNYPVTSNGTAKLHWHISNANHDLNSPSQPTNTNQITSISKNSHLNHLTHAHHLGISKISAISTSCSSLTKAGTIAKAGLLACTFTPLLAIAGIGAVGYLGYKAYDYYYGTSDKINEEIANENPSNNIKTANCKALKEISLRK